MTGPRYALRADDGDVLVAECVDLEDFFVGDWSSTDHFEQDEDASPDHFSFALTGVDLKTDLSPYIGESPGVYSLEDATVDVLDAGGHRFGSYPIWGTALSLPVAAESRPGTGYVTAYTSVLPHAAAQQVWEDWRAAPPSECGRWAGIARGRREGWVEAAQSRHFSRMTGDVWTVPPGELRLAGRQIEDLASFFCALGETFGGPGGYFGSTFLGTADCLRHTDRPAGERLRLVWEDFAVARSSLAKVVETGAGPRGYVDIALETLTDGGVDVVLA